MLLSLVWLPGVGVTSGLLENSEKTRTLASITSQVRPSLPARSRARGGRLRSIALWIVVALLLGLAWRLLRYALDFPLWGDEASIVLSLMRRDFLSMIKPPLENAQIAPLGWMWIELATVKLLGLREYAMRIPALVSSLAALLIFWRFAPKLLDKRSALLALAILAVANYPVRHGNEIKPYAMDMLVSLILTCLAWRVAREPASVRRWAALCLVAAVAPWISYPSIFVMAGLGVYLAYVWRRASWQGRPACAPGHLDPASSTMGMLPAAPARPYHFLVGLAAFAIIAGASFLIVYFLYTRPHAMASPSYFAQEGGQWADSFPPFGKPWRLPLWLLKVHAGNMLAYPWGGNNFASTGTLILVITGSVTLWRRHHKDILLLLLAPLAMTLIAAAMRKYPYGTSARISLYMAPAFCMLAGLGLRTLICAFSRKRDAHNVVVIAAAILCAAIVGSAVYDCFCPYKVRANKDCRDGVRAFAAQSSPGDKWFVVNSLGHNTYSPQLTGSDSDDFYIYATKLAPSPVTFGKRYEMMQPPPNGRFWLIYYAHPKLKAVFPHENARFQRYLDMLTFFWGEPQVRKQFTLYQPEKGVAPSTIQAYVFAEPSAPRRCLWNAFANTMSSWHDLQRMFPELKGSLPPDEKFYSDKSTND